MTFVVKEEDYLAHYGIARKSGRYPWGSGKTEEARARDFFAYIKEMKKDGMTDPQIAEVVKAFGGEDSPRYTSTHLRATRTMALAAQKAADITKAQNLKAQGYSNVQIGKRFNPPKNESAIRGLLAESARDKIDILNMTSDMLRNEVNEKGVIDVGKGVPNQLKISKEKLRTAVAMLESEGYNSFPVQIDQLGGGGNKTTTIVLTKPEIKYKDVVKDQGQIKSIGQKSDDGGRSHYGMLPPIPISSSRVAIKYADEGGAASDGMMLLRPGVKDLDMAHAKYSQVRIDVDGTHYLKGMAVYDHKNQLPDGVDIMFHTNKKKEDAPTVHDVLKKKSDDPDNPFGAVVDQIGKRDVNGHLVEVTSAVNVVNTEGDWSKWSKSLASQTLSKQSSVLAQQQLDMTFARKKAEFDSIMALTNPTVKQHLLMKFSDSVDASSVHLKAAALPRSAWYSILPVNTLKPNEVYAPKFRDGEQVALIRYPHGGTFEIPELTVNNRHAPAIKMLGKQAPDAIGIHSDVAARLSGADFDGDAVLVVPNNNRTIRTQPPLQGLKNFDPQSYRPYDGMRTVDRGTYNAKTREVEYGPKGPYARGKGTEMGKISNLITDMTIQGASTHELAAAIRHSMVVIDSEKHHLNYKQSAIDNNIASLRNTYQVKEEGRPGGAATLISRAKSEQRVRDRKPRSAAAGGPIDKATGKKMYEPRGDEYLDPKTGKVKFPTTSSTKLAEAEDARTLISIADTKIEHVYADHSNRLKAMANESRRVAVNIPAPRVNKSAKVAYAAEVKSLTAKVGQALENAPRERAAQVLAGRILHDKLSANPGMDDAHIKRIQSQALAEARRRTGARKKLVTFEGREWEAIQAGALPGDKLKTILANTDIEKVKELATPRTHIGLNSAQQSRARQMKDNGYTLAEIADQLGVSTTTLDKELK